MRDACASARRRTPHAGAHLRALALACAQVQSAPAADTLLPSGRPSRTRSSRRARRRRRRRTRRRSPSPTTRSRRVAQASPLCLQLGDASAEAAASSLLDISPTLLLSLAHALYPSTAPQHLQRPAPVLPFRDVTTRTLHQKNESDEVNKHHASSLAESACAILAASRRARPSGRMAFLAGEKSTPQLVLAGRPLLQALVAQARARRGAPRH
jgi:hypothetical protein